MIVSSEGRNPLGWTKEVVSLKQETDEYILRYYERENSDYIIGVMTMKDIKSHSKKKILWEADEL